jgi:hypothetical protein
MVITGSVVEAGPLELDVPGVDDADEDTFVLEEAEVPDVLPGVEDPVVEDADVESDGVEVADVPLALPGLE